MMGFILRALCCLLLIGGGAFAGFLGLKNRQESKGRIFLFACAAMAICGLLAVYAFIGLIPAAWTLLLYVGLGMLAFVYFDTNESRVNIKSFLFGFGIVLVALPLIQIVYTAIRLVLATVTR